MGRRVGNTAPVPKTTWAISIDTAEMVLKYKNRNETTDDLITRMFAEWRGEVDLQKQEQDKEVQKQYAQLYESQKKSLEVYAQELENISLSLKNDEYAKQKFAYYIQRFDILRERGPIVLEAIDLEKANTGISQTELYNRLLT